MAIDRKSDKKAPSQNPNDFYDCEQNGKGTTQGGGAKVPDRLTSGPMREKIYGRPDLSKP